MDILSIEILSDEALIDLCRHARLERKKKRQRHGNMTGNDVLKLLEMDFSQFRAALALGAGVSNSRELALQHLSDYQVGPYEDKQEVALLELARNIGKPVLVELAGQPSKRCLKRLRQSAKFRKLGLRLFQLIDCFIAVRVQPNPVPTQSDMNFLKTLGINGR
jgi:hypothetical protein